MQVSPTAKKLSILIFGVAVTVLSAGFIFTPEGPSVEPTEIEELRAALEKKDLVGLIGPYVEANQRPPTVLWPDRSTGDGRLQLIYTIDEDLQEHTDRLMRRFRPDYGALIAMDAVTGEILTMSSYSHAGDERNLNLVATFPAASIFKMITAAAAIDTDKANAETVIPYNGRNHTLYRRDVESRVKNKWTRYITLREAFSRSVNTFFGKLGLYHVGPKSLSKYANLYGFNQQLSADFPIASSESYIPTDDDWAVVEAASGFNRETTLSPVHGALLAAAVANEGVMMEPYLVHSALGSDGSTVYSAQPTLVTQTITREANEQLQVLMRATVKSGTSRTPFRRLHRHRLYKEASFGGKTGSLTGRDPVGKTDWFVGYMQYKDRRIALAAVSVHEKIWRVKSSQLASSYFEEYLYRLVTEEQRTAQLQDKEQQSEADHGSK